MSIEKVEVTNAQGDLLSLVLEDISNGYIVKDISGMGPVKANIVSSAFATLDGEQYQASSRGTRNITFKIGFEPNVENGQTVLELRTALYSHFMTNLVVDLAFYMHNGLVVNIKGRVEANEPNMFTYEPENDISIICFDPDFIDLTPVQIHDRFTTADNTPKLIYVDGSSPTGLTSLTFTAPASITDFTIYHTTPSGEQRTMLITTPLIVNDVVNICTVPRKKSITRTRSGVTSSILQAKDVASQWVSLEKGDNLFYVHSSSTTPAPVLIDFYNRYGGL